MTEKTFKVTANKKSRHVAESQAKEIASRWVDQAREGATIKIDRVDDQNILDLLGIDGDAASETPSDG